MASRQNDAQFLDLGAGFHQFHGLVMRRAAKTGIADKGEAVGAQARLIVFARCRGAARRVMRCCVTPSNRASIAWLSP